MRAIHVRVTGRDNGWPGPDSGAGPCAGVDEMVRAACRGDERAFQGLYRTTQPGLLRYLRGLVGDEAEDVAAEAWLQIARDLRAYRGEGAGFRGWAVSIARHRALDHLRRRRSHPVSCAPVEQFADLPAGDDTAVRAIEMVAMRASIAWIATLPREQAEAILLRVVVGMDAESAARVLGKRAGAVRTAAYRGLRRLARQLAADPSAGTPRARRVTRSRVETPEDMR